jgi:UDP-GlcNAc:undecaprenyl-phosphate GlcNAc-1-phosphate transferase
MTVPILLAGSCSFLVSWLVTRFMIWFAPRIGFVDKPGHRKIHHNPKPLGGGVAIFLGFAVPLLAVLIGARLVDPAALARRVPQGAAYLGGVINQTPLALGLLGAMLGMHILGLIDDKRALGPYLKLFAQLAIITALVAGFDLRVLTFLDHYGLGRIPSIVVTVLWITAISNALNFLDNMDGLSAGVAAICGIAFLVTTLSIGQFFVAGALAMFIGASLGFLMWNFPPARIFMGDSGSLLLGLVLGTLTVRTTYLPPGHALQSGWYSVMVPVIVLAMPLYDLIVVSAIRISRGKSPFVGDTNHFSHRLVARGMSRRTAVLCIYLVTFATSIAAILLPQVATTFGAMLIFAQTVLVLAVVALLEQHPMPASDDPSR